jgi:16S rRNA (guanine966-N2)-methyltransferase
MKSAGSAANQVRIGGGSHRSRVIRFPDALGLRPTGARIRETLFNWLGQSLTGCVCLDLFAGSGALGFEAASRGAARVVMCETNRAALTALHNNAAALELAACEIVARDCMSVLTQRGPPFDVVFCDPPFANQQHQAVLAALLPRLATDARVYVEAPEAIETWPIVQQKYVVSKRSRAGAVHFALLSRASTEETV